MCKLTFQIIKFDLDKVTNMTVGLVDQDAKSSQLDRLINQNDKISSLKSR